MQRLLPVWLLCLAGCGSEPRPVTPAPEKKAALAPDYSRHFPPQGLLEMTRVAEKVMGKSFLPGGNVAKYRSQARDYELFLVKTTDNQAAALLLFDYKKELASAKLIPSFGGYFGQDGQRNVFVFPKNAWLAGIVGLNEKQADTVAREFASRLP